MFMNYYKNLKQTIVPAEHNITNVIQTTYSTRDTFQALVALNLNILASIFKDSTIIIFKQQT